MVSPAPAGPRADKLELFPQQLTCLQLCFQHACHSHGLPHSAARATLNDCVPLLIIQGALDSHTNGLQAGALEGHLLADKESLWAGSFCKPAMEQLVW